MAGYYSITDMATITGLNKQRVYRFLKKERIIEDDLIRNIPHYNDEVLNLVIKRFDVDITDKDSSLSHSNDEQSDESHDEKKASSSDTTGFAESSIRSDERLINDESSYHKIMNKQIEILEKELYEKGLQMEVKDEQIKKLQQALDQQQQLQLKTQQMLEEKTLILETAQKKKWWQVWR